LIVSVLKPSAAGATSKPVISRDNEPWPSCASRSAIPSIGPRLAAVYAAIASW
jgi:hypothetical protein